MDNFWWVLTGALISYSAGLCIHAYWGVGCIYRDRFRTLETSMKNGEWTPLVALNVSSGFLAAGLFLMVTGHTLGWAISGFSVACYVNRYSQYRDIQRVGILCRNAGRKW